MASATFLGSHICEEGLVDFINDVISSLLLYIGSTQQAKQFQSSSSPGQSLPAISNFVRSSLTGINPTDKLIKHYTESLVLDTMFRYNKNIGFRG
ncbi:MAG: hypothetical protein ACJ702_02075, partial [Nitrososphaeraceae archaeon]